MMFPVAVLFAVFLLIAMRNLGPFKVKIWQAMLFGALVVILTGQITPEKALNSINYDVMLFLFGMFVVGVAVEESGYLSCLANRLFRRARSVDSLILLILFGLGSLSAFLMNDTCAIIGTPLVISLARRHKIPAKALLLTLAFAVTIGSAMSPIGNPQNLLIAVNGNMTSPFISFFRFLLLPTAINLFLAYIMIKIYYGKHFRGIVPDDNKEEITDPSLAKISQVSLAMLVLLVSAKILSMFFGSEIDFRLTYIALFSALPVIVFSPRRFEILRKIDWPTLVFFAAMFVLMQSVWDTGFFQSAIDSTGLGIRSLPAILLISVGLSQFISNVPLAALYLPLLMDAGASVQDLVALAAGSTIAGNLLILGAASNVIIIQNAEKKGETITFFEFARIGIPLTLINVFVYWIFLFFL